VAYLRGTAAAEALKAHLARHLPAHMIPGHLVTLDAFPLTPNRKVDRKALPAPAAARAAAPRPGAVRDLGSRGGRLEAEIAEIWSHILGVSEIGAEDSFFDLGGHSLLAVQAHREMRATLGVAGLSITDIFRCPKLGALAARVAELRGDTPDPANDPGPSPAASGRAEARAEAMARRRAMRSTRRG
jgi:hypothetical protein